MKKTLALILAALMLTALFAGCGKEQKKTPVDIDSVETLGDIFSLGDLDERQSCWSDKTYVIAFGLNGVYYRATASLPADVSKKIDALEFDDPKHDEKMEKALSPVKIDKFENLTDLIPPQEELDKVVGKTAKELFDDGWSSSGWSLDDMEFWLVKDAFQYTVKFDGKLEYSDDLDIEKAIEPYTVKSIVFSGLGNAADIDEE